MRYHFIAKHSITESTKPILLNKKWMTVNNLVCVIIYNEACGPNMAKVNQ
jgi:hypothetical protein